MLCHMCTGLGAWNRFNIARGIMKAILTRRRQRTNIPYTADLMRDQICRGSQVIFEHPWSSDFVKDPIIVNLIEEFSLYVVRLAQCRVGLAGE